MTLKFELLAEPECGVVVDSSRTLYLVDGSSAIYQKYGFTKDQSVILNILTKGESFDELINNDTQTDCEVVDHTDLTEVTHHTFKNGDGIYTIHHLVIPKKSWVEDVYLSDDFSGTYAKVVYYDDGGLWLLNTETLEGSSITTKEVLQLIQASLDLSVLYTTSVTLCTCGLHECYYNIARKLLENVDACSRQVLLDLIYKRDIVWMGINVIEYLLDEGNIYEAEAILLKIEGCNGVCSNELWRKPYKNCGCGKQN